MDRIRRVELTGGLIAAALVAGGGAVALASSAWAAGSGYLPPSTFTIGNVPGSFSDVVTTSTLTTSGGTLQGTFNGTAFSVDIPSGALPGATQVVVYAPQDLSAVTGAIAGVSVVFLNSAGQPISGTLGTAASVTISNAHIVAGDTVDEWNGSSYVPYSDATVSAGKATITFSSDPSFVVVPSSSSVVTPVPQATTPTTGVPVLGEAVLAACLVGLGGTGLLLALRRRASSV